MRRGKRKRNKVITVLFFPAIIFLWIVGWSLYWIGHQKESRKPPISPEKEDHISLKAIPVEEPLETKI